jgi:hypothetical protein
MNTTLKLQSSIYPKNRPSMNEWCKEFNVSSRVIKDTTPLNNAQRIMELWDGFHNMKEKFIKRMKVEEL